MTRIPLFARKFLLDAAESMLAVLFTLNLVIPGDLDGAKAQALIIGTALAGAIVPAARRALPGLVEWIRVKLAVPAEG